MAEQSQARSSGSRYSWGKVRWLKPRLYFARHEGGWMLHLWRLWIARNER